MSQQVLIVTPVALFEITDEGKTVERGNCQCAIVGLPTTPPKFSLVCYNEKRETLATSTITASNEHSLQMNISVGDYVTFRDSRAKKWAMTMLKSQQVDKFLATLCACMFGAGGMPTHTATIADYAPPKSEARLGLSNRARVRYSAFGVKKNVLNTGSLPVVGELIETNGDRLYNFQPVQSPLGFLMEAKGFEAAVAGMMEDTTRVVIVPSEMQRNGMNPHPSYFAVAYVVQLQRIQNDDLPTTEVVPTILSIGGGAGDDGVPDVTGGASGALMVVGGGPSSSAATITSDPFASAPSKGTDGHVGSGIPAEHMMMIQKSAAQINTATTSTRDLHDKVVSFREDWQQKITRPKPSALTPNAIEQNVKSLILENERVRDEIARRDELIRSLDDRNRDLQKRVDKAAMIAQQLLDEKAKTVETSSDMKLEKDRVIMKLQEEISRATNERDDVYRHQQTIKKLLEASDAELRDVKGKAEVHNVQAKGLAGKLDVVEDQLAEERSRRKAMEAKAASLQEEIRSTEAELHLKTALLEETRRRADAERNHQAQVTEDERQRRAFEAQQLRTEIIEELQTKENRFQADRSRTVEEFFKRGHAEGKEIGRRQARIDVEARIQDLQLDAQRAKTELDAYKTEHRQTNEEAMAENRRLESIVRQLKTQVDELTKKKANTDFATQGLQLKVRNAEDNLYLALTNVAHRLTRPTPASDLLAVLATIKNGGQPSLAFQQTNNSAELDEAKGRRATWAAEEFETIYAELQEKYYQTEFLPVLKVAADDCSAAVRELWEERDRSFAGTLLMEETSARYAITSEENAWFASVLDFFEGLFAAERELLAAEAAGRAEVESEEGPQFWEWIGELVETQRAEREALELEAFAEIDRDTLLTEQSEYADFCKAVEAVVFEKIIGDQQLFIDEEGIARNEISIEESDGFDWFVVRWGHLVQCVGLESEETSVRLADLDEPESYEFGLILAEERALLEAEAAEIQAKIDAEQAEREEAEAALRFAKEEEERVAREAAEAEEREREEEERRRLRAIVEQQEAEEEARQRKAEAEEAERRAKAELEAEEEEAAAAAKKKDKKEKKDKKKKAAVIEDEDEEDDGFAAPAPAAASPKVVSPPSNLFGSEDSDEDADFGAKPKKPTAAAPKAADLAEEDEEEEAPKPAKKAAPAAPPKKAAAGLFGDSDDSDDDAPARKPAPAAAPKKAAAAPPKKPAGGLFGDSSDDSDGGAAPPRPAPKKAPAAAAKKAPAKKGGLFGDSDDSD